MMPRVERVHAACQQCGGVVEHRPKQRRKFCSLQCYWQSKVMTSHSPCAWCGVTFHYRPSKPQRFCSIRCKAESERTLPRPDPRPCIVCGTVFKPSRKMGMARFCSKSCEWRQLKGPEFNARISRETTKQRADVLRGRGEGKAYRKLGGRHAHRVIAEQKIGRSLWPKEIVHHIDGNILNNAPDNLDVLSSQSEHAKLHGFGTYWRGRSRKDAP